jgi:alkanesulfonate monooxygenase SsuD/methylene tetrahydromethanopterin reductase-like flavin-dependent oxidoreductase (luciferase family)
MRSVWKGEPPFDGSDPIGPLPSKAPRVIGGFAGPKAISACAGWADGLYAFSITGQAGEIQQKVDTMRTAWKDAGRPGKPWLIGGFWYSLADDAEAVLRHYTYDYLKIAGHDMATQVAQSMTQFDKGLILDTMRAMKDTGIDELFMVPASAGVEEVTRLADLVAML